MDTTTQSIKEQLATLAELQQADLAIADIQSELDSVQDRVTKLEQQLTAVQSQVEESHNQLLVLKKQYRADEAEVRRVEDSAEKSEAKLRSVKTNKEYQSLLKEIDDFKQKGSDIQDQMLVALDQIDTAEAQAASCMADLKDLQADIQEQKREILGKAETQSQKLIGLQQEREAIWRTLPPKLQVMYGRANHQGRGIGVAAVINAVCQVCRMNIPPQLYIELIRMDSMRLCPNCQRIIYPDKIWEGHS